jgi:hypothetical protein
MGSGQGITALAHLVPKGGLHSPPLLRLKGDSWVESNSKASSPLGESTLKSFRGQTAKGIIVAFGTLRNSLQLG